MKDLPAITPALNSKIVENAMRHCSEMGRTDRKTFDQQYRKAIRAAGYTPGHFMRVMREIGAE